MLGRETGLWNSIYEPCRDWIVVEVVELCPDEVASVGYNGVVVR